MAHLMAIRLRHHSIRYTAVAAQRTHLHPCVACVVCSAAELSCDDPQDASQTAAEQPPHGWQGLYNDLPVKHQSRPIAPNQAALTQNSIQQVQQHQQQQALHLTKQPVPVLSLTHAKQHWHLQEAGALQDNELTMRLSACGIGGDDPT